MEGDLGGPGRQAGRGQGVAPSRGAEGGRGAGDRLRPGGRGDRLAPPEAARRPGGAFRARHVQRDHRAGDSRRVPRAAASRHGARAGAAHAALRGPRLVGLRVSPALVRSVSDARSAGRVQSVALRLVVEREREIRAFVPRPYWEVAASVDAPGGAGVLAARRRPGSKVVGAPAFPVGGGSPGGGRGRPRGGRPAGRFGELDAGRAPGAPAVHDVVAAAGGERAAQADGWPHDGDRAVALRERCDHLHADGLGQRVGRGRRGAPEADRRGPRRRVRRRPAEPLQGRRGRPGGPRGDSADGVRSASLAAGRGRRGAALRADLPARDAEPDGPGPDTDGPRGGGRRPVAFRPRRGRGAVSGLRGPLASRARGRLGAAPRRGGVASRGRRRPGCEAHEGAEAVHAGDPRARAREAGHRPSVDLRADDRGAARTRVRRGAAARSRRDAARRSRGPRG